MSATWEPPLDHAHLEEERYPWELAGIYFGTHYVVYIYIIVIGAYFVCVWITVYRWS